MPDFRPGLPGACCVGPDCGLRSSAEDGLCAATAGAASCSGPIVQQRSAGDCEKCADRAGDRESRRDQRGGSGFRRQPRAGVVGDRHSELVRAALQQAARRQRTDLRPGRDDRGASHAADELADPRDQYADRAAGRAARDRSRPVCAGPRARSIDGIGQSAGPVCGGHGRRCASMSSRCPRRSRPAAAGACRSARSRTRAQADKLRTHLSRKYQTANVIEFTGPTGHWVRIRPFRDDKDRAVEIAKELKPSEGEAYLVRLD